MATHRKVLKDTNATKGSRQGLAKSFAKDTRGLTAIRKSEASLREQLEAKEAEFTRLSADFKSLKAKHTKLNNTLQETTDKFESEIAEKDKVAEETISKLSEKVKVLQLALERAGIDAVSLESLTSRSEAENQAFNAETEVMAKAMQEDLHETKQALKELCDSLRGPPNSND